MDIKVEPTSVVFEHNGKRQLRALRVRAADLADEVPKPIDARDLERFTTIAGLRAHYDQERDLLMLEFDGIEFTSSGSPRALTTKVKLHQIAQQYPYALDGIEKGLVKTTDLDAVRGKVFATEAEGQAYIDAVRKQRTAREAAVQYEHSFWFDKSIFEEPK